MKQFFYKSGLLTSIIIVTSVMFIMCGVSYFNKNDMQYPVSGMSDEYVFMYVDKSHVPGFGGICAEVGPVKNYFKDIDINNVAGIKLYDGSAIVTGKDYKGIELLSGRFFEKSDFVNNTNTALICEDLLEVCSENDGKRIFSVYGNEYEVVGIYPQRDSAELASNQFLLNLYAEGISDELRGMYGFYDNGVASMGDMLQTGVDTYTVERAIDDIRNVKDYGNAMVEGAIATYLLVGIFVMLNIFSAIYLWLKGKKKEIVVRKMFGAKKSDIYWWIIGNYMTFVVMGFGIGVAIVAIIIATLKKWGYSRSLLLILGCDMEWSGVGCAFVLICIISFVFICIIANRYLKKEIIQIIHNE